MLTVKGEVPVFVAPVKLPPNVKPEPSDGPPWISVTTKSVAVTVGVGTAAITPVKVWLTFVVDAIVPVSVKPPAGVEK